MNATGMKMATIDSVAAMAAKLISLAPRIAAARRGLAMLAAAIDVLQHQDRIIDHDADRQRQRQQCHEIDREPNHLMARNVPISDVGIDMQTFSVVPIEPRNRNVTTAVSMMPSSSASLTSSMSSMMNSE